MSGIFIAKTFLYKNRRFRKFENFNNVPLTIFGYIYFLIFDKLSYVFIPNEFKLNKKTVFLIFLSQILSISRTYLVFFDIKNILEKKLSIFLISTLMYIVLIFYINDLDEFLYIFISYFLLMATLYLLMSRKFIYFLIFYYYKF